MISGSERSARARGLRRGAARVLARLACAVVFPVSSVCAQAPDVDDETRSAARQMARDAIELMNAENYAAADDLLRRAYELVPAPTVAVLRGQALEKLDRLIEAAESYEAARHLPDDPKIPAAFHDAKQEATTRLEALRKQIPLVTITVSGVDADDERLEIRLDDRPMPGEMVGVRRPVDPGQHLIVAAFEQTVHDTRWVTLERGEHIKVLMRVDAPKEEPPPPPPPPPEPPPRRFGRQDAGWIAFAVGAGGFAAGIVSGVWMMEEKAKLDDGCRPACPVDLKDELQTFRRSRTASALGYGIGFTGLVVGGGLLLSDPRTCDTQSIQTSGESAARSDRSRFFTAVGPRGVSFGGAWR